MQDRKFREANIMASNPFWDFSLRVYERPGVASACLSLQEELGADVNLLLYALWAGRRGHLLSREECEELLAAIEPWHKDVVRGLRQVRLVMKRQRRADKIDPDVAESLRQRVKKLELEAERLEQDALYKALPLKAGAGAPEVAMDNLKIYLRRLKAKGKHEPKLLSLVEAAFG